MMKEPPCYFGCPYCNIKVLFSTTPQKYSKELFKGIVHEKKLIYPHGPTTTKRTDWIPKPDNGKELGNGIKELSPLAQFMELPKNIQIDLMHTTYSGTVQRLLITICERKIGSVFQKNQ